MVPTPDTHPSIESIRFAPQQLYVFQAPDTSLNQAQAWLNTIETSKLQRRQGGQNPGYFIDLDQGDCDQACMVALKQWMTCCLIETRKMIPWNAQFYRELEITQIWINISEQGNDHAMHTHPLSILSGILCLSEHIETNFYVESIYSLPSFLCPDARDSNLLIRQTISLEAGTLVIFPSALQHDVSAHADKQRRISLSFNSFFKGTIGDPAMLSMIRASKQVNLESPY